MITYFRYTFSEYEIEEILGNSKATLNKITFKANDNKEYHLVITGQGYYLEFQDGIKSKLYPYEDGLYLHSIAKIKVGRGKYIYLLLDSEIDSPLRENIHTDRLYYMTTFPISAEYIELLASTINFNDDNDFILLCSLYIMFRLNNKSTVSLNKYLEEKLSYYGYTSEDFYQKFNFKDTKNSCYLTIVNLALSILYDFNRKEVITLDYYSLTIMDLQTAYIQYFNK